MHVFSGRKGILTPLSMNAIADAIRRACEKIELHYAEEFGGESSAAFREGLVKEYNEKHMKECPDCGMPLHFLEPDYAECTGCGKPINTSCYDRKMCHVDEEGVAEYVGNKIGNGYANHTGDYFHLGEVRGRTLYFGVNPSKRFYTMHKGDNVAIVLGRNDAEIPEGWTGHAAYFSELFYVNEPTGEIRVSHNILNGLLPRAKKARTQPGKRKIHERRSEWLMFIADLFSRPLNPSDFTKHGLRPKVAHDWFVENYSDAPKCVKEYQRDLRAFREIKPGDKCEDKREAFIILLLRTAANKKRTMKERMGIAKLIPELILYLQKVAEKNPTQPAEITRGAWQYCKDGTKEYVAITDIEDFFDRLAERLGEDAA